MAEKLIAERNAVVGGRNVKGRRTRTKIREGKIYRSDDPIVKGREHFFRPVEDATQEPGEKRSIRKPRKQAESTPTAAQPKPKAEKVEKVESAPTSESDESGTE